MSDTEDWLYGLIEIADRRQAAEQAALGRGVRDLHFGTQRAVPSAMTDSLVGAATDGVAAVQAATLRLLGQSAG